MDPGPPQKRRRPAVACTECRRRKISCDLASPCGQCSKSRSSLKCVYNNDGNGNGNHSSDCANSKPSEPTKTTEAHSEQSTTLAPMAHSGHYISLHGSTTFGESMLNLDTITLDAVTSSHTDSNDNIFDAVFDVSNRGIDPKLMSIPSFFSGPNFSSLCPANGPMDMSTQPLFPLSTSSSSSTQAERLSSLESETTRFETQPYNLHIQPEGVRSLLRGLADCTRDGHYQLPPGSDSVQSLMGTLTKLERTAIEATENKVSFTAWSHRNLSLQANLVWDMLPPRTQCNTLLDAYFKSFESVLRILHVPSFMQRYEQFWDRARSQRNDADETFVCTLLVAIALGSCVSLGPHALNDSRRALQEQAAAWIAYSREFLSRKVVTGAHENFEVAQLMCLVTLARHTQAQSADPAVGRYILGDDDLLRIGIRMRLYREPVTKGAHGSTTKDAEMHRRLWATMLELSLQSCLADGLPAPIAPDGYDCEPPSNIADEDIDGGFSHQGFTPTTTLRLLAKTQRLRLGMLHLANMSRTPKTSHEAYRISAELNEACNANMQALNAMKPSQPIDFQRKLLDLFTRSFVLALHTSFSGPDFADPAYYYSRRMRMEMSMLLLVSLPPSPQAHEKPGSSGLAANMPVSGLLSGPETACHSLSGLFGSPNPTATSTTNHVAVGSSRPVGNHPTSPPLVAASDAYMSLLLHGNSQGHFVRIHRQMIATLCLDVISELEKNEFPILNQLSLQHIRSVLRVGMQLFESRMRSSCGANSAREFIVFAAAAAYIDALLLGCGCGGGGVDTGDPSQDLDETTARAVLSALNAFTEILHSAKL